MDRGALRDRRKEEEEEELLKWKASTHKSLASFLPETASRRMDVADMAIRQIKT